MRQKEQVQKSFAKIFFDSALASMMRLEKKHAVLRLNCIRAIPCLKYRALTV